MSVTTMASALEALDVDDPAAYDQAIMSDPGVRTFFLVTYVIVFLSCVFGNLLILLVVVTNSSMRNHTNICLANLAVADLFVGIFCVFPNMAHFVLFEHGSWRFGRAMCHSYVYVLNVIPNVSAGILVLLSLERLVAVLQPMKVKHFMSNRVLCASTLTVWVVSLIMNLPYLFAVQYIEYSNDFAICTRQFPEWNGINVLKVVTIAYMIVWYLIPLSILIAIYVTIGIVLLRTTRNNSITRSSQSNGSAKKALITKAKVEVHHTRKLANGEAMESRKRVIRLVVAIVASFALLSLPRYMYLTWTVWREANAPRCLNCLSALIQPTTFLLLFINSGINPILYAFLSQKFRAAVMDMFTCAHSKEMRKKTFLMKLRKTRCSDYGEKPPRNLAVLELPVIPEQSTSTSHNKELTMAMAIGVVNDGYGCANDDTPLRVSPSDSV